MQVGFCKRGREKKQNAGDPEKPNVNMDIYAYSSVNAKFYGEKHSNRLV